MRGARCLPKSLSLRYTLIAVIIGSLILFLSQLLIYKSDDSISISARLQSSQQGVEEEGVGDRKYAPPEKPRPKYPKTPPSMSQKLRELRESDAMVRAAVGRSKTGSVSEKLPRRNEEQHFQPLQNPELTTYFAPIVDQAKKIKESRIEEYLEDCNVEKSDKRYRHFFNVLDRTKTPQCKAEIAVVECSVSKRTLYPKVFSSMPNYCTNDPRKPGMRLARQGVESEDQVFIVYLLQLSGRSDRQVERLIKSIYSPDHAYLLHVDTGSEYLHAYLSQLIASVALGNIQLMKSRFQTLWGSSHLLLMQLAALREATQLWPQLDFIINLSESDFPIRPVEEAEVTLSRNKHFSFLSRNRKMKSEEFVKKQGINYTFYQCDDHLFRLTPRRIPNGVKFEGGSDWFVLARNFIDYLLHPPKNDLLVDSLKRFFAYSLLPSESFFATLIGSSPLCQNVLGSDLKFASWVGHMGCSCSEKSSVDWCGCSPLVIRNATRFSFFKNDVLNMNTGKRPNLFARKFDSSFALLAVNEVEDALRKRLGDEVSHPESWNSFWLNFYHYKFDSLHSDRSLNSSLSAIQALISFQVVPFASTHIRTSVIRADHHFKDDKYLGDVFTVSLKDFTKSEMEDHADEVAIVQTLVMSSANPPIASNSFNSTIFTGFAKVTAKFDGKENISRSFNYWVSVYDKSVHVYASLRHDFVSRLTEKLELSLSLTKLGAEEEEMIEDHVTIGPDDRVLKKEISVVFDRRSVDNEWALAVFDSNKKNMFLEHTFPVFGPNTKTSLVESYFKLHDKCLVSSVSKAYDLGMYPECKETPWSLFHSDPKSAFFDDRNRLVML